MNDFSVDLTNCELEPIHIPGQIQSHGFMVILDKNRNVKFCSENINDFIEVSAPDLLAKPISYLEALIADQLRPNFITNILNLGDGADDYEQTNPYEFLIKGSKYFLIVSKSDALTLLEFEIDPIAKGVDIQKLIGRTVSEILGDKNLKSMLNNAALQVKNVIQYDRVMVYQFAEDGHGEVVAESKEDHLEPWLGLHYPASDIPQQARNLYKLNLTRIIADVNSTPSKIITFPSDDVNVDLTPSQLRAVSPIHIQYLKNMGVASSFSISLIYKEELWGLIACHNYSPKFIDYKHRSSAQLIGQILSSALEFRQDEENQLLAESLNSHVDKLGKYMQQHETMEKALTAEEVTMLDVTKATGAVLLTENKIIRIGLTPNDEQIGKLVTWIKSNVSGTIYHTDHLSAVLPEAVEYKDIASGIITCVLAKELNEYIIWFKPEYLHAVKWAGDPNKPAIVDPGDGLMKISPRESFKVWTEAIVGRSESWSAEEIKAVTQLKEEINEAVIIKSAAIRELNAKLKAAYEELDTFSYTISHDLKNPLSAIQSYAQLMRRSKTLGEREKGFAERIEDRSVKMTQMINEILEHSRIGRSDVVYYNIDMKALLTEIITDFMVVYEKPYLTMNLEGTPGIAGDRMMISQVFANLIGNAVKYSQKSQMQKVTISGTENDTEVIYSVRDNGIGIEAIEIPKVFDLFKRMGNVEDIEGTGVGLAIVKRIVDKHKGRIWVESELGTGTTFLVAFPKV